MNKKEVDAFIRDYLKDIRGGTAAVFAGAGLSKAAGHVDWKGLIRPMADELGLDVDDESDLVAIAQYYVNKNGGQRGRINKALVEEFCNNLEPTDNHLILAGLPIQTYWTTNYDRLIELSLERSGKCADVKVTNENLATTRLQRDAVVYKMHGDVSHPDKAVLIKDDYERYGKSRSLFLNALAGDLVSKSFLFLGVGFADPNLDYVLGRVRVVLDENQRSHYCLMKVRDRQSGESDDQLSRAKIRQQLFVEDLLRFGVKTLLVDNYSDITEILRSLERAYRRRTIFLSGSAVEYGEWSKIESEGFLRDLSKVLVQRGFRIVTGFGLGVGDAVITGAIEEVYAKRAGHLEDSLVMRPFPRANPDGQKLAKLWESYRHELLAMSGVYLAVFGNKNEAGKVVLADGVRKEFEIAKDLGLPLVPVGATGYMAHALWQEVFANFETFYPGASADAKAAFGALGGGVSAPDQLLSRIDQYLQIISKE